MTTRETIFQQVVTALEGIGGGVLIDVDADAPRTVPRQGHIVVRDGEVDEPDRTIGDGAITYYHSDHIAIEVYALTRGRLDSLTASIEAALPNHSTFGGSVLFSDRRIDMRQDFTTEGGETAKAVLIDLMVEFETTTALT